MPEKDSVEDLKSKLYSRQGAEKQHISDIRTPLSRDETRAPLGWRQGQTPPPPPVPYGSFAQKPRAGVAAKFFGISVLFFLAAAGVAGWYFFVGASSVSPQNIDIQIVAPPLAEGGKEVQFQYLITNRNRSPLQLADLVLTYPAGTRDPTDSSKLLEHDRQSIGTINPGQQITLTSHAILFGEQGEQKKVLAALQYSVQGSNAIFEKDVEADFAIGSSPVSITLDAPSEIIAGEPFVVTLNLTSNAAEPVASVLLEGQYPFGFSVQKSDPAAGSGGTTWRLGTLSPGSSKTISITAVVDGQDGDTRVLHFLAGSSADTTETHVKSPFISVPLALTVRKPFVVGTISLNGQTGKTISAPAGSLLTGSVSWKNNLLDAISNAEISLTITGSSVDKNSIQTSNGFYQSANSSITWSKDTDPTLAQVAPGASGVLQFSFATLAPGSGGVLYTNPTATLALAIKATRAGGGSAPNSISSAATMEVRLTSAVSLTATSLHSSGPFTDTGPVPPRAETPTAYTVVWTIKNASNAIGGASVSAVLPSYVQFVTGNSPGGEGVTYDSGSRTVTWAVGDIRAGTGYNLPVQTAAFQVTLNPSTSQVGTAPALTGGALLTGQDRFAQTAVSANAQAPTTRTSDADFKSGMDIVGAK